MNNPVVRAGFEVILRPGRVSSQGIVRHNPNHGLFALVSASRCPLVTSIPFNGHLDYESEAASFMGTLGSRCRRAAGILRPVRRPAE